MRTFAEFFIRTYFFTFIEFAPNILPKILFEVHANVMRFWKSPIFLFLLYGRSLCLSNFDKESPQKCSIPFGFQVPSAWKWLLLNGGELKLGSIPLRDVLWAIHYVFCSSLEDEAGALVVIPATYSLKYLSITYVWRLVETGNFW